MDMVAHNLDSMYYQGMSLLSRNGVLEESRNGPVYVYPTPVMSVYNYPTHRVLLHPGRDANPFFHLMEAMWMLMGRQDLGFLHYYNKRMAEFSDNGTTLYGAYGYRWTKKFSLNQIEHVICILKEDPTTRRAVLTMWQANDLILDSKDVPCNTHIYFRINNFKLDMTVCCRSNDIIWGAYGANAVHFSILQEYIAAGIGLPVGVMFQLSNNYHAYVDIFINKYSTLAETYKGEWPQPMQLVHNFWSFKQELSDTLYWIEHLDSGVPGVETCPHNPFLRTVGKMGIAWWHYKHHNDDAAIGVAQEIPAEDWKVACVNWLKRRKHGQVKVQRGDT